MMERKDTAPDTRKGGSKYLYEPFPPSHNSVPLLRLETLEQVQVERWKALDYRLAQMEGKLDRLEKRVWLTIFGVAAIVLEEAVLAIMAH